VFVRCKSSGNHKYLQIVENRRVGPKVRQRVVATLGRLDRLQASGALDRFLASAGRFAQASAVLAARDHGDGGHGRVIGPALVFERLWRLCGCRQVLQQALAPRRFRFDLERAVFLTVLHRLFDPGSDRQAARWASDQAIDGAAQLDLHHLYRTMQWLGEPLPDQKSDSAAKGVQAVPRCIKDRIEEDLFARRRDLFSGLQLVFFDTTSHYFHGAGGSVLGRRGKSKDFRPGCRQVVVGLVLDSDGMPLCTEIWPGNTADVTTLVPVAERLSRRFQVQSVCLVADRGMLSKAVMDDIRKRGWGFILGVRLRSSKEFREKVLTSKEKSRDLNLDRAGSPDPLELEVQEVVVEDADKPERPKRRYIVCRSREQAKRDRLVREETLKKLQQKLAGGAKSLVGNRGFRRYLKADGRSFAVDEEKIAAEEQYDGLWALQVDAPLSAEEAVVQYKQLWRVERCFREAKSLLRTRPVHHRTDEAIRGHIFCSFLALVLRRALEQRMRAAGIKAEWADVVRDLQRLRETEVAVQGKQFVVRDRVTGVVTQILRCVQAKLPPTVRLKAKEGSRAA